MIYVINLLKIDEKNLKKLVLNIVVKDAIQMDT